MYMLYNEAFCFVNMDNIAVKKNGQTENLHYATLIISQNLPHFCVVLTL